jgi:hypothetical protein
LAQELALMTRCRLECADELTEVLNQLRAEDRRIPLLMDRAYEGNETKQLVLEMNIIPVVPLKSNRRDPWDYDCEPCRKRHQVERLFRRLKGSGRIFSRFEKLDVGFLAILPTLSRHCDRGDIWGEKPRRRPKAAPTFGWD